MARNQEDFKAGKFTPMIKGAVTEAMRAIANSSGNRSTAIQTLFEQRLKEKNIDVVFRRNAQERICGVTFIDPMPAAMSATARAWARSFRQTFSTIC
jgi:hypothetical protein